MGDALISTGTQLFQHVIVGIVQLLRLSPHNGDRTAGDPVRLAPEKKRLPRGRSTQEAGTELAYDRRAVRGGSDAEGGDHYCRSAIGEPGAVVCRAASTAAIGSRTNVREATRL